MKPIGQVGYEAYAAFTDGKTFDGRDMPVWDALPDRIRDAWDHAARAVVALDAAFAAEPSEGSDP